MHEHCFTGIFSFLEDSSLKTSRTTDTLSVVCKISYDGICTSLVIIMCSTVTGFSKLLIDSQWFISV